MARIRTIKPEFPLSESMGRISREARLCFILLWPHCDDEGRIRANSRMLASLLFPYDDDAPKLIGKWLTELVKESCLVQYEVGGNHYIEVTNWLKHQKIDHPRASILPPSREASREIAKPREDAREDWTGLEGNGLDSTSPTAPPKKRKSTLPENWTLSPELIGEAYAKHPNRDIPEEMERFKAHHIHKQTLGIDWMRAFMVTWLGNADKFAPDPRKPNGKPPPGMPSTESSYGFRNITRERLAREAAESK